MTLAIFHQVSLEEQLWQQLAKYKQDSVTLLAKIIEKIEHFYINCLLSC